MTLPAWLAAEPGPRMLVEAVKLFGVHEYPGGRDNPVIMGWSDETGAAGYSNDGIPWCGLFMGVCAKRATWEYQPKGNCLWARNWASWGDHVDTAMLGDVLVWRRGRGGHVGLYVGEDETHYHVLGGNQSDSVCIVRKSKSAAGPNGLHAIRRAPWRIAQPANVRRVFLTPAGVPTSTKED